MDKERFGCSLEMVDLYRQEPNRNRRECKFYWDELFRYIGDQGIRHIDLPYYTKWAGGGRSGIPLNIYSVEHKYSSIANFVAALRGYGIDSIPNVSVDPYYCTYTYCTFADVDHYFAVYRKYCLEAIEFARQAGSKTVTISVTPYAAAIDTMGGEPESFLEAAVGMIDSLGDAIKENGLRLCLKNEYWSLVRGRDIFDFIRKLSSECYYAVDTAHLAIAGVDPSAFISKCGDRIGAVQFTDTRFTDDNEAYLTRTPQFPEDRATQVFCDPGWGAVDFGGVATALDRAGYDGAVICCSRQTRDVYRTLLRTHGFINDMAGR